MHKVTVLYCVGEKNERYVALKLSHLHENKEKYL